MKVPLLLFKTNVQLRFTFIGAIELPQNFLHLMHPTTRLNVELLELALPVCKQTVCNPAGRFVLYLLN